MEQQQHQADGGDQLEVGRVGDDARAGGARAEQDPGPHEERDGRQTESLAQPREQPGHEQQDAQPEQQAGSARAAFGGDREHHRRCLLMTRCRCR